MSSAKRQWFIRHQKEAECRSRRAAILFLYILQKYLNNNCKLMSESKLSDATFVLTTRVRASILLVSLKPGSYKAE
jgi:hypothetical protein